MRQPGLTGPDEHRCRASAYVAVLSVATIVTVIGLAALTLVRVQLRSAEGTNDLAQARLNAQSAIEMGLHWINSNSNWRDAYSSGVWVADLPIGDGTFTLEGVDPSDNSLDNSATDTVVLTGTGVKGDARHKLQVTLVPETQALTCLEVALHANNDLIFETAVVNGDQIISANDTIQAVGACTIYPACESVNGFVGAVGPGSKTSGITPRTMPNPATVFDFYTDPANGTPIDISTLTINKDGYRVLGAVVLSPASNPYGATNPEGVYVIDCQGQDLTIQDCRIVGTLVLLNTGSDCQVAGSVNWEPAVANYPALLVSGTMSFEHRASTPLDESDVGKFGTNFNPPGTPYGLFADLDKMDTYPTVMRGLVYVSGDAQSTNDPVFDGVVVVGNTLTATGSLDLTYKATFLSDPPPGFGSPPKMVISPGSWQQVVD